MSNATDPNSALRARAEVQMDPTNVQLVEDQTTSKAYAGLPTLYRRPRWLLRPSGERHRSEATPRAGFG